MTKALELNAPVDTLAMEFTRDFDAPVQALFRAHAEPDLVRQWLGPHGVEMTIDHWDFRTGGGYRYLHSDGDGQYRFNGVFHKVRDGELIIQTFEYEGWPHEVSLDTIRFEELPGGRSRLVDHSVFPSVEVLENMVEQGMEYGMREGYEKLDELIAGRP